MDLLLTFNGLEAMTYLTGQSARCRPTLLAALILFVVLL